MTLKGICIFSVNI